MQGAGGSIVAVSSISGTLADRDMGAYCVSKAGIDMLVRVAATEWGVHGIRVNAVGPGVTRTPMLANPEQLPGWVEGLTERTALGRLGEADDIAEAIVAVLEMSWVTGQTVFADGGLALHSPIDSYGQVQRLTGRRNAKTRYTCAKRNSSTGSARRACVVSVSDGATATARAGRRNLAPGVHGVLGRFEALSDQQLGCIGGLFADHRDLGPFGLAEVLQHERAPDFWPGGRPMPTRTR